MDRRRHHFNDPVSCSTEAGDTEYTPLGNPLCVTEVAGNLSSHFYLNISLWKKEFMNLIILPLVPILWSCFMMPWCQVVSYAFSRTKNTPIACWWFANPCWIWFERCNKASAVEQFLPIPNRYGEMKLLVSISLQTQLVWAILVCS